jgi:hypothetical protein
LAAYSEWLKDIINEAKGSKYKDRLLFLNICSMYIDSKKGAMPTLSAYNRAFDLLTDL